MKSRYFSFLLTNWESEYATLRERDKTWVHPTRAEKDHGKQTSCLTPGWSYTYCTDSGTHSFLYPSWGAWKRWSQKRKQMDVEELQREVWVSKQVLNTGAEKAETRRGGKGYNEVFLGKVEGWEEKREARNKLFRASSTRKYVLVKDFFTHCFPVRKSKSHPSNYISSGWILRAEGEGH